MSIQLTLEKRTAQGKKLKALRAAGQVPSVVYGESAPILAASAYNDTEKALLEVGYHSPIMLDVAGTKQLAIVKNVALDPVSRRILNIEFQAVNADEVVEATTPIRIVNFEQSEAAKLHYVIMQVMEEIDVKAKPSDLPEDLEIDASKLAGTEDKLTVAQLALPKNVVLADKEIQSSTVIANVYDPAAEAAARDSEAENEGDAAASEEGSAED